MISTQLPDEAYQLATEYGLGEPIRIYRTNKRPQFKIFGWALAATFLTVLIIAVIAEAPSGFTSTTLFVFAIVVAIMLLLSLAFFIPLMLLRPTTVYIYSSGFITHHKKNYQSVRWEEIEWVSLARDNYIIYLTSKKPLILSRFIEQKEILAQEIELKARLIKQVEGRENLEQQFELMRIRRAGREQEKENISAEKQALIAHETPEEAFKLGEAYQLGEVLATHHAGFKSILRKKAISMPIYYTLLLAWILLLIGAFSHFSFFPDRDFLQSAYACIYLALFLASSFFMPRVFARFVRLHFYTEGFIAIESGSFEVVRWEQVEKVIYHKTMPIFSSPFCHIYLTNGETLAINGYLHNQRAARQTFDEHVINKVQAG